MVATSEKTVEDSKEALTNRPSDNQSRIEKDQIIKRENWRIRRAKDLIEGYKKDLTNIQPKLATSVNTKR